MLAANYKWNFFWSIYDGSLFPLIFSIVMYNFIENLTLTTESQKLMLHTIQNICYGCVCIEITKFACCSNWKTRYFVKLEVNRLYSFQISYMPRQNSLPLLWKPASSSLPIGESEINHLTQYETITIGNSAYKTLACDYNTCG